MINPHTEIPGHFSKNHQPKPILTGFEKADILVLVFSRSQSFYKIKIFFNFYRI